MFIFLLIRCFVLCMIVEFKKVNNGSECSKGIVIWILFERIKNIFVLKNISELGCLVIIF